MEKRAQNIPIWFGCWGKSRYGLFPGGSPDMVCFLGEVPRYFGSCMKSRYGSFPGGSPDMVWFLGEVPRCDVTPHIE